MDKLEKVVMPQYNGVMINICPKSDIIFDNLVSVVYQASSGDGTGFLYINSDVSVYFPKLKQCALGYSFGGNYRRFVGMYNGHKCKLVDMPECTEFGRCYYDGKWKESPYGIPFSGNIEKLNAPKCGRIYFGYFEFNGACKCLIMGNISGSTFIGGYGDYSLSLGQNLIHWEVCASGGEINTTLNVKGWNAVNALKDDENELVEEGFSFSCNLEQFLHNFKLLFYDRFQNRTGSSRLTLTLSKVTYMALKGLSSIESDGTEVTNPDSVSVTKTLNELQCLTQKDIDDFGYDTTTTYREWMDSIFSYKNWGLAYV